MPASDIDSWRAVNRVWKSGASVWRDTTNGNFYPSQHDNARELKKPRIGLYKSYMPIMDEGWTRWLFENFGFDYTSILNPEIDSGALRRARLRSRRYQ